LIVINDIIDAVKDGKEGLRGLSKIRYLVIHRVGIDLKSGKVLGDGVRGTSIAKEFVENDELYQYTKGENPYTFYVGGHDSFEGDVWQALPLDEIGKHARRWNIRGLGIGCIGDFRYMAPSFKQYMSLVDLCVALCGYLDLNPLRAIKAHDELKGGSSDPGKECPGRLMDISRLRLDVYELMKEQHRQYLIDAGARV